MLDLYITAKLLQTPWSKFGHTGLKIIIHNMLNFFNINPKFYQTSLGQVSLAHFVPLIELEAEKTRWEVEKTIAPYTNERNVTVMVDTSSSAPQRLLKFQIFLLHLNYATPLNSP